MKIFSIIGLLSILLSCRSDARRQVSQKIVLNEEKCNVPSGCAACRKLSFRCDKNVSIMITEGKHQTLRSDGSQGCFAVDLVMYGSVLSLDSFYYANIQNKDLQYISGFIEGTYVKKESLILLYLRFLNAAINSSVSESHTFLIEYNLTNHAFGFTKFDLVGY